MYYAWRFCEGLHHHQLEYTSDSNYWGGVCLEYDDVKDYVSDFGLGYQNMQKMMGGNDNGNKK